MKIPLRVTWAQSWIGVRTLAHHLGWWGAMRAGLTMDRAVRRGEPFGPLPPSANQKEEMSRSQIAPAIVLYKHLKEATDVDALAVVRDVVLKSTVPWMRFAIGVIDRDGYQQGSPEKRREMLEERTTRFFNMTIDEMETEKEHASFRVTSCFFPGRDHLLKKLLWACIIAWAATTPLTAFYFDRIVWGAPLINVLIVPLVSLFFLPISLRFSHRLLDLHFKINPKLKM